MSRGHFGYVQNKDAESFLNNRVSLDEVYERLQGFSNSGKILEELDKLLTLIIQAEQLLDQADVILHRPTFHNVLSDLDWDFDSEEISKDVEAFNEAQALS